MIIMPKRKKTTKKRKPIAKKKLVGYTKVKKKYALVFKKGRSKPTLGSGRYGSKKTLLSAAKRYVK
jgi:hypothetical protein